MKGCVYKHCLVVENKSRSICHLLKCDRSVVPTQQKSLLQLWKHNIVWKPGAVTGSCKTCRWFNEIELLLLDAGAFCSSVKEMLVKE